MKYDYRECNLTQCDPAEYILTTDGLSKKYGGFTALRDVSIHITKGAIYGLIGRNGAGKTTLLRLVCGLQKPTEGSYTLFGRRYSDRDIYKSRRRMGTMIEYPAVYPSMTAAENLQIQYRMLGMPSFKDIPELLALVGLENTGSLKVQAFSMGMKQRLGLAVALAGSPDFLVLDEPTNGLDPMGIIELRELLLKLNRERQMTILISSHMLSELPRLATHYGFLDRGRLLRELNASELEAECRKCISLTVSDSKAICAILDEKKLSYRIFSDTNSDKIRMEIYSQVTITELVQTLSAADSEILSVSQREEGLESYMLNLVELGADDTQPK